MTVVVTGVEAGGMGGTCGLIVEVEVVTDVLLAAVDAAELADADELVDAAADDAAVVLDAAIVIILIDGTEDAAVETGPESCGFDGPMRSFCSSGLG